MHTLIFLNFVNHGYRKLNKLLPLNNFYLITPKTSLVILIALSKFCCRGTTCYHRLHLYFLKKLIIPILFFKRLRELMEEISTVSSNITILNEEINEETSTTWNARTVTIKNQRSCIEQELVNILKKISSRFEQVYCMSRCTASRDISVGVKIKRDENKKTQGILKINAPSKDKKDNVSLHVNVQNSGNASVELKYDFNTKSQDK